MLGEVIEKGQICQTEWVGNTGEKWLKMLTIAKIDQIGLLAK